MPLIPEQLVPVIPKQVVPRVPVMLCHGFSSTYPKLSLHLKNGRSMPDKKPRGPVFLNIPVSRLGRGAQVVENDRNLYTREHAKFEKH